jgi:hypothetical protein
MMTEFVNSQRISLVNFSVLTTSTEKICQIGLPLQQICKLSLDQKMPIFSY